MIGLEINTFCMYTNKFHWSSSSGLYINFYCLFGIFVTCITTRNLSYIYKIMWFCQDLNSMQCVYIFIDYDSWITVICTSHHIFFCDFRLTSTICWFCIVGPESVLKERLHTKKKKNNKKNVYCINYLRQVIHGLSQCLTFIFNH